MNDSIPSDVEIKNDPNGGVWDHIKYIKDFILFRVHLSLRLRIIVNSVIIVFPALLQFIFFSDAEYIISFFLVLIFLLSVFFLFRIRLVLTMPLVIASMVFSIYIVLYSKSVGATAIIAIFNTRVEAMYGFMKSPKMITGMLFLLIVMSLYYRVILLGDKNDREMVLVKGKGRIVLFGMLFVCVFAYIPMSGYLLEAYPFSVVYDSTSYVRIISRMKNVAGKEYEFTGSLKPNFKEEAGSYILVVGETDRRASWSLYGYGRKTNVFLREIIDEHPRNFILFQDYTSTGQTTYPSLMSIFSVIPSKYFQQIPDYPSFTRILTNISFNVYFVSTYSNIFNTFIGADQNIFVTSGDDMSLLPEVNKILNEKTGQKKFIIVHLKGSHFAFSDYNFTYKDYILPSSNHIVDKYDNSIVHTSEFLKNLAKMVLSSDSPVCAWFVSDHGENLNDFQDGVYGHGTGDFTKYEVELPSVMFFNDNFAVENPELKRIARNSKNKTSHSNVSHTFFGLTGIYPSEYLKEFDLSSPAYEAEEPYLVNSDLLPMRYSKIKIKGLDESSE